MAANVSGMNFTSGAQYMPMDMSGNAGSYNFGNTMNPTSTSTSANPFGMPTVSPNPGSTSKSTSDIWNTLGLPTSGQGNEWDFARDLAATYGKGAGSAIFQYLQRGAGFNSPITDQAIQAQDAAMQREAMQGWGNIASILGQSGISPNSSVEALSLSNYFGDVTAKQNALAAQEYYNMWSQSQGQEASLLQSILGGSQQHQANKGHGWMDVLSGALGIGGSLLSGFMGGGGGGPQ